MLAEPRREGALLPHEGRRRRGAGRGLSLGTLSLALGLGGTLALLTGACGGQDASSASSHTSSPSAIEGTPASKVEARLPSLLGRDGEDADDPSLALDAAGRPWVAWISFRPWNDRVLLAPAIAVPPGARPAGPSASPPAVAGTTTLSGEAGRGDHFRTALGLGPDGALWAVYASSESGDWELYGRAGRGGDWSAPRRLTRASGPDLFPKLARDGTGALWLVWQGVRGGDFDVLARRLAPAESSRGEAGVGRGPGPVAGAGGTTRVGGPEGAGGAVAPEWGPERILTASPGDDWAPDVAGLPSGGIAVVHDTYREGSFDVHLLRVAPGADGSRPSPPVPIPIAATPRFEAHPSIACDGEGRLWVAWDEAEEGWGREGSTNLPGVSLHGSRRIRLAVVEGDRVLPPAVPLADALPQALRQTAEMPVLSLDSGGRLWVFFRSRWVDPALRGRRNETSLWELRALVSRGRSWGLFPGGPAPLPGTQGGNDEPMAVVRWEDGVLVAVASDGRNPGDALADRAYLRWFCPMTADFMRRIRLLALRPPRGAAPPQPGPVVRDPAPLRPGAPPLTAPEVVLAGVPYRLLFGDLHRHTDVSRCAMNLDGSMEDAYRYALDAFPLDFLAVTDHEAHMTARDWWRDQKQAAIYHIEGRLTSLFGYERATPDRGHRNLISPTRPAWLVSTPLFANPLRDDAVAEEEEDLFAAIEGREMLSIPHTPAGFNLADESGIDWRRVNPLFEPVVELFQSYRGSYEAAGAPRVYPLARVRRGFVREALRLGLRTGFIASSDHQTSGGAFAVVYATSMDRRAVLDGLRARRCYAATARIQLLVSLGSHPMGAIVDWPQADLAPTFDVAVEAGGPLARVELLAGRLHSRAAEPDPEAAAGAGPAVVREIRPAASSWSGSLQAPAPTGGATRWVYVRVTREDGEMAWSSPIWIVPPGGARPLEDVSLAVLAARHSGDDEDGG